MVFRGPLTDDERAYRDSLPPLSDAERERIRRRRIQSIEEYAEGALPWAQARASQAVSKGKLPARVEIAGQVAFLLDELRRLGEAPGPHLIALNSYMLVGRTDPESDEIPLDEQSAFLAAVRYSVDHKGAPLREIADAAGVDKVMIARWKKRPQWIQETHDIEVLRSLGG